MKYQRQAMEIESNGHDLELAICTPLDEGRAFIVINCMSCLRRTTSKISDDMDEVEFLRLMEMEMYLHVEGFDTGWETFIHSVS